MKNKILVIDDEPDVARFLAKKLEKSGYQVSTAANGREGLKIAREQELNLILTDVIMPQVNGLELYKELKKNDRLSDIPVVVFTAWSNIIDTFEDLDVDGYLIKPFAGRELLEKIDQVLNHPQKKKQKSTVLICQQDAPIIEEVVHQLQQEGWRVKLYLEVASNQQELLAKAATTKPDMVFVDILSKDFPGPDIIQSLRNSSENKELLIFAYTNITNVKQKSSENAARIKEMKDACIQAGASRYIESLTRLSFVLILYEYL